MPFHCLSYSQFLPCPFHYYYVKHKRPTDFNQIEIDTSERGWAIAFTICYCKMRGTWRAAAINNEIASEWCDEI